MTSNTARGLGAASSPIDETAVAEFLERHADFFERHSGVLARLRLPHARNGATISLVERQVEVLREKHAALEQRLAEFVRVARANDQLAERIQKLTRRLLGARTLVATLVQVEASLREDFDAGISRLVLPGADVALEAQVPHHLLRAVPTDEPALRSFETLFASGKPRCGQVRDVQRDFLFGDEAATVGSIALVPLGANGTLGLLAVGSPDAQRFHPGMSTEFLARMGELIADSIARFR
ncbi:MAG: DUF484 family protein [Steroidobacteraceae bacterium]